MFRLSVDTSTRGIEYMLYQLDPDDETQKPRIIRFGSKSLSPWQQSYFPTKLELLGMVVSILDYADYLRGNSFIAECNHQVLTPLYQKQFKGAIYKRWMSILQQFSFEIIYKKADDMQVPDALSRRENSKAEVVESHVEYDRFFPFFEDVYGKVKLPNGQNFSELIFSKVADVQAVHLTDNAYDADTLISDPYDADADESDNNIRKKSVRKMSKQRRTMYKSDTGIVDKTLTTSVFENSSISTEKIKQLQRQDITLTKIIDYLENDTLPESQKQARPVLLKLSDNVLIDRVLFHSRIAKAKRNKMMDHYHYQIVLPEALINTVLKVVHDSPLGGYCGINNTSDRAKEHFFFPRMGKIIPDFVQSCYLCKIPKVSNKKTKQEIVSFPTPAEPFQVWQMDLCGPYPVSVNENTYVFTAVDMFTKLLFAYPLRNKDAITVCEAIYRMFTTYGVCQTLIYYQDRGSELTYVFLVSNNAIATGLQMEERENF
ncbi:Hypothetical predicted protein [Mytilus galloprovincialis]|uniref:Integrase catalytic domain-containing protein n=1 Tax=Mytilus galloprovincialis TaxID=29158 RepID=A0A8B6ED09_MYTGA|nr:Hypothetical predicted protein [Mytilus galloprovincialis]